MIRSVAADGRPDLGGVFTPIERPRVLERIAGAARYRIAAVIAPAGFGKSVAVRQYLSTLPSSVVYEVPRDATTLVPFVRSFARTIAERLPAVGQTLPSALRSISGSESPGRDLAAWLQTHLRDLDELIVLDDLHISDNDPEIGKFVTALIDGTPQGPRWLICSRSAANLPLASWLAYGEMDLVVDAIDLRFTLEEARLSARSTRVAVRDEELNAMLELVEGWPTALTFALRTSTRASDLRAVTASTREMIYRYLAEQVYHSLDDETRRFLRFAALLPRLEIRFAVAGGFDQATAMIEALRERVAFITSIDSNHFRLHDLFRDFIRHQIELDGAQSINDELRFAASVLERENEIGAALERYIEANAAEDIERVLREIGFTLFDRGEADVVERALASLPRRLLTTNNYVLALRAAIEEYRGRNDQAESWYRTAIERSNDPAHRRSTAIRLSRLLADNFRSDAIPMLEGMLAENDLDSSERCELLGMLAVPYVMSSRMNEARRTIDDALALAELAPDDIRARIYGRACGIASFGGDEQTVERYGNEAVRIATENGNFSTAARTYTLLSTNAAWKIPERATALWYAQQAVACAAKAGDMRIWTVGLLQQYEYEVERGNHERLLALDEELRRLAPYAYSRVYFTQLHGRANRAAWDGDFAAAHQTMLGINTADLKDFQRYVRLVFLGLFYALDERRDDAIAALEEAEKIRAGLEPTTPMSRDTLCAGIRIATLAQVALGRKTIAARLLRQYDGTVEGFERFDQAIRGLVGDDPAALESGLAGLRGQHFGGYARLCERVAAFVAHASDGNEVLTTTELAVLRAVANGRSNKDIAEEQRRTVNTIRTHVSSVLRKLHARTRGEAVAAARRLELL